MMLALQEKVTMPMNAQEFLSLSPQFFSLLFLPLSLLSFSLSVPDAASLPVSPLQSGGAGVNTSLPAVPPSPTLLLSCHWLLGGSESAPAH